MDDLTPRPGEHPDDYLNRLTDLLNNPTSRPDPLTDLENQWAREYADLIITDATTLDLLTPQQRARRAELLTILKQQQAQR